jgi:hypothetical protein
MTRGRPTSQKASTPVTEEARLVDLLRQAEGYAYALAHGCDLGGQPDRAYGFVALAERLRNTASDANDLACPIEPHSIAPPLSLKARAYSLRRLLRGTASQHPSDLAPWLRGKQPSDLLQICIGYQLKTFAVVDNPPLSDEDRVSVCA